MSFDIPLDPKIQMLIEIDAKLGDINKNIETVRELNDELSFLLRLILAVNATNAGLVKPNEDLATEIKNTLADRGIVAEVAGSEPPQQVATDIHIIYNSAADSTAYVLSGNMPKNEPGVVELHWPNEKLADDGVKLRWLRQYRPELLSEFRREWEASTHERDRRALSELERLSPLI